MIKTTKSKILDMELLPNKVIVKILRKPEELILDNDIKLFLDYSFQHELNAPTRGLVVNICSELNTKMMNWITELEIEKGDIAVYNYVAAMHSWKDDDSRTLVDEEKNIYFILDYEDIFCVKRGKELIPVNGYILCRPMINKINTNLYLPEFSKKKKSDKYGLVKYAGKKNKAYQLLPETGPVLREELSDVDVNVGDLIVFDKFCDLPIESEMHSAIDGRGEILFRLHRCNVKALVDKRIDKKLDILI